MKKAGPQRGKLSQDQSRSQKQQGMRMQMAVKL